MKYPFGGSFERTAQVVSAQFGWPERTFHRDSSGCGTRNDRRRAKPTYIVRLPVSTSYNDIGSAMSLCEPVSGTVHWIPLDGFDGTAFADDRLLVTS